jgi:hypothetical protein
VGGINSIADYLSRMFIVEEREEKTTTGKTILIIIPLYTLLFILDNYLTQINNIRSCNDANKAEST